MNIGTASDVEEQVAGPKIASSPPFTPALSASKILQPLHQPPLLQTFQELEFKELDDPKVYYNFADVLQILRPLVGWWTTSITPRRVQGIVDYVTLIKSSKNSQYQ